MPASASLVAALVGFASTVALVLAAAAAVGATPDQAASWGLAAGLGLWALDRMRDGAALRRARPSGSP